MADLILSNPGTTWSGNAIQLFLPKQVGIIIMTTVGTTLLSSLDLWLAYQSGGSQVSGNYFVKVFDTVTVEGIPIPIGDVLTQSFKSWGPAGEINSASFVRYSFGVDITLDSGKWYAIMLSVDNYDATPPDYGRIFMASRKAGTGSFTGSAFNTGNFITFQLGPAPGWLLGPMSGMIKFFLYGTWFPVPEPPDPSIPDDLTPFPPDRPDAYDPDLIWQPGEWTDPDTYVPGDWGSGYVATGGGRWGQNLVVAGNQKIYYEPHEGV